MASLHSYILKFGGILYLAILVVIMGCQTQDRGAKLSETYSHPNSDDPDIKTFEKFVYWSFENIIEYFPNATSESDFMTKYAAFNRSCDLDFNASVKIKYGDRSVYSVDVRAKLKEQDENDRSNLGLVNFSYVSIPSKYDPRRHRYPGSKEYRKTTDFQKRLSSFMASVVKNNKDCLKFSSLPKPQDP